MVGSISLTCPYSPLIHFCSVNRLDPGSSGKSLPALGSWNHWGMEGNFCLENNQAFVVEGTFWRVGQRKQKEGRDPATPPETGRPL